MTRDPIGHERAAELLPWLVNGTLRGDERERVERHVRGCLTCRAELAGEQVLAGLVRRHPAVHVSAEVDFERLQRRIDAEAAPRARFGARWPWAAAAAVALAGVAAVLALVRLEDPAAGDVYRTLAEDAGGPLLVDVIFAEITEAEIRELLAGLGAEIVAGPSPRIGRYTLRAAGSAPSRGDAEALLRRLQRDGRVRFAALAYSSPAEAAEDGSVTTR